MDQDSFFSGAFPQGGRGGHSAPGHSHHPGSPCGPASAGRCIAFGHCCRRGRYLKRGRTESGVRFQTPSPGGAACGLTGGKAAAKEHVEEVFGGDVGLKAAVEVPVAVAVPGGLALVVTKLVVLFPFLGVAEDGVGCADGWKGRKDDALEGWVQVGPQYSPELASFGSQGNGGLGGRDNLLVEQALGSR